MFDSRKKRIIPDLLSDIQHRSGRINLSKDVIANFVFDRITDDVVANRYLEEDGLNDLIFINEKFLKIEGVNNKLISGASGSDGTFSRKEVDPASPPASIENTAIEYSSFLTNSSPFKNKSITLGDKTFAANYYFSYRPENYSSKILTRYNARSLSIGTSSPHIAKISISGSVPFHRNEISGSRLSITVPQIGESNVTKNYTPLFFEERQEKAFQSLVLRSGISANSGDFFGLSNGRKADFEISIADFKISPTRKRYKIDPVATTIFATGSYSTAYPNTTIIPNAGYDLANRFNYYASGSTESGDPTTPTSYERVYASGSLDLISDSKLWIGNFVDATPANSGSASVTFAFQDTPDDSNTFTTQLIDGLYRNTFDTSRDSSQRLYMGHANQWAGLTGASSGGKSTFSCWVKPVKAQGHTNDHVIFSSQDDNYLISIPDSGKIKFTRNFSSSTAYTVETEKRAFSVTSSSSNRFESAQWTHICVTYNGPAYNGTAAVYINGMPVAMAAASATPASDKTIVTVTGTDNGDGATLGDKPGGTRGLYGQYADVGFWNRVLTADEIYELYSRPLANYKSSTNLQLHAQLTDPITKKGAAAVSPSYFINSTIGKLTDNEIGSRTYSAYTFSGEDDRIDIGKVSVWDAKIGDASGSTKKITLSAWVYQKGDSPTSNRIITFGANNVILYTHDNSPNNDGPWDLRFYLNSGGPDQGGAGTGGAWSAWAANKYHYWKVDDAITKNTWHHVAVTYDANTNTSAPVFYVDGVRKTTAAGGSDHSIGSQSSWGNWQGLVNIDKYNYGKLVNGIPRPVPLGPNVLNSYLLTNTATNISVGSNGNLTFNSNTLAAAFAAVFPVGSIVRLQNPTLTADFIVGTYSSGATVPFTASVKVTGSGTTLSLNTVTLMQEVLEQSCHIGNATNNSKFFNGLIAEVAVWNSILTDSEVFAVYSATQFAHDNSLTTVADNLVNTINSDTSLDIKAIKHQGNKTSANITLQQELGLAQVKSGLTSSVLLPHLTQSSCGIRYPNAGRRSTAPASFSNAKPITNLFIDDHRIPTGKQLKITDHSNNTITFTFDNTQAANYITSGDGTIHGTTPTLGLQNVTSSEGLRDVLVNAFSVKYSNTITTSSIEFGNNLRLSARPKQRITIECPSLSDAKDKKLHLVDTKGNKYKLEITDSSSASVTSGYTAVRVANAKTVTFSGNFGSSNIGAGDVLTIADGSSTVNYTTETTSNADATNADKIGVGSNRAATAVVDEFVKKINASNLGIVAIDVGGTATSASMILQPITNKSSGALRTITITEDGSGNNVFGGSADFCTITNTDATTLSDQRVAAALEDIIEHLPLSTISDPYTGQYSSFNSFVNGKLITVIQTAFGSPFFPTEVVDATAPGVFTINPELTGEEDEAGLQVEGSAISDGYIGTVFSAYEFSNPKYNIPDNGQPLALGSYDGIGLVGANDPRLGDVVVRYQKDFNYLGFFDNLKDAISNPRKAGHGAPTRSNSLSSTWGSISAPSTFGAASISLQVSSNFGTSYSAGQKFYFTFRGGAEYVYTANSNISNSDNTAALTLDAVNSTTTSTLNKTAVSAYGTFAPKQIIGAAVLGPTAPRKLHGEILRESEITLLLRNSDAYTPADQAAGVKITFNGNFGMGSFGTAPDPNAGNGSLRISDGTKSVDIIGLDYSNSPGTFVLVIEAAATKTNLHSKTFDIADSSNTQVQFRFDNTVSTTSGVVIGLQNADNVKTIATRIRTTIANHSFNIYASDESSSAGNDARHIISLTSTNTTTTFTSTASTSHFLHKLGVGAGGDNAASSVVSELVSKINAISWLNVTAAVVTGNTSENASLTLTHSDAGTVTVTEDPDSTNSNSGASGHFGGSSGFTTLVSTPASQGISGLVTFTSGSVDMTSKIKTLSVNKFSGGFQKAALMTQGYAGLAARGPKTIITRIYNNETSSTGVIFTLSGDLKSRYYLLADQGKFEFRLRPLGASSNSVYWKAIIERPSSIPKDKWYTLFIVFDEASFERSDSANYIALYDVENHGAMVAYANFVPNDAAPEGVQSAENNLSDGIERPRLFIGYGNKDSGGLATNFGTSPQLPANEASFYNNFYLAELSILKKRLSLDEADKIAESHLVLRTKSGFRTDLPKKALHEKFQQNNIIEGDFTPFVESSKTTEDLVTGDVTYPHMMSAGTTGSIVFTFTDVPADNSGFSIRLPNGKDFQVIFDSSSTVIDGFTLDTATSVITDSNNIRAYNSAQTRFKCGIEGLISRTAIVDQLQKLIKNINRYSGIPVQASRTSFNAIKLECQDPGSFNTEYNAASKVVTFNNTFDEDNILAGNILQIIDSRDVSITYTTISTSGGSTPWASGNSQKIGVAPGRPATFAVDELVSKINAVSSYEVSAYDLGGSTTRASMLLVPDQDKEVKVIEIYSRYGNRDDFTIVTNAPTSLCVVSNSPASNIVVSDDKLSGQIFRNSKLEDFSSTSRHNSINTGAKALEDVKATIKCNAAPLTTFINNSSVTVEYLNRVLNDDRLDNDIPQQIVDVQNLSRGIKDTTIPRRPIIKFKIQNIEYVARLDSKLQLAESNKFNIGVSDVNSNSTLATSVANSISDAVAKDNLGLVVSVNDDTITLNPNNKDSSLSRVNFLGDGIGSISEGFMFETSGFNLMLNPEMTTDARESLTIRKTTSSSKPFLDDDRMNLGLAFFAKGSALSGSASRFMAATRNRVRIEIDINPVEKTTLGFTTGSGTSVTDGFSAGNYNPMGYFNFSSKKWESISPTFSPKIETKKDANEEGQTRDQAINDAVSDFQASAPIGFGGTYGFSIHRKDTSDHAYACITHVSSSNFALTATGVVSKVVKLNERIRLTSTSGREVDYIITNKSGIGSGDALTESTNISDDNKKPFTSARDGARAINLDLDNGNLTFTTFMINLSVAISRGHSGHIEAEPLWPDLSSTFGAITSPADSTNIQGSGLTLTFTNPLGRAYKVGDKFYFHDTNGNYTIVTLTTDRSPTDKTITVDWDSFNSTSNTTAISQVRSWGYADFSTPKLSLKLKQLEMGPAGNTRILNGLGGIRVEGHAKSTHTLTYTGQPAAGQSLVIHSNGGNTNNFGFVSNTTQTDDHTSTSLPSGFALNYGNSSIVGKIGINKTITVAGTAYTSGNAKILVMGGQNGSSQNTILFINPKIPNGTILVVSFYASRNDFYSGYNAMGTDANEEIKARYSTTLGGSSDVSQKHFEKWNGSAWVTLSSAGTIAGGDITDTTTLDHFRIKFDNHQSDGLYYSIEKEAAGASDSTIGIFGIRYDILPGHHGAPVAIGSDADETYANLVTAINNNLSSSISPAYLNPADDSNNSGSFIWSNPGDHVAIFDMTPPWLPNTAIDNASLVTNKSYISNSENIFAGKYSSFVGGIITSDNEPNKDSTFSGLHYAELPLRGRPVSNFGFPFSDTFKPAEGQKLDLSNYLDGPFLLEKFEIICSSSIRDEVQEGVGRVLPETHTDLPFSNYGQSNEASQFFSEESWVYNDNSATSMSYHGMYDDRFRNLEAQRMYDRFYPWTSRDLHWSVLSQPFGNRFKYHDGLWGHTPLVGKSTFTKERIQKEGAYHRVGGNVYARQGQATDYLINDSVSNANTVEGSAWWRCDTFFLMREKQAIDARYDVPIPSAAKSTGQNNSEAFAAGTLYFYARYKYYSYDTNPYTYDTYYDDGAWIANSWKSVNSPWVPGTGYESTAEWLARVVVMTDVPYIEIKSHNPIFDPSVSPLVAHRKYKIISVPGSSKPDLSSRGGPASDSSDNVAGYTFYSTSAGTISGAGATRLQEHARIIRIYFVTRSQFAYPEEVAAAVPEPGTSTSEIDKRYNGSIRYAIDIDYAHWEDVFGIHIPALSNILSAIKVTVDAAMNRGHLDGFEITAPGYSAMHLRFRITNATTDDFSGDTFNTTAQITTSDHLIAMEFTNQMWGSWFETTDIFNYHPFHDATSIIGSTAAPYAREDLVYNGARINRTEVSKTGQRSGYDILTQSHNITSTTRELISYAQVAYHGYANMNHRTVGGVGYGHYYFVNDPGYMFYRGEDYNSSASASFPDGAQKSTMEHPHLTRFGSFEITGSNGLTLLENGLGRELNIKIGSPKYENPHVSAVNTALVQRQTISDVKISIPKSIRSSYHPMQRVATLTVRIASTANVDISTLNNGDSMDGVSLATDDLILLKNQTSAVENGVYKVGASNGQTVRSNYDVGSVIYNIEITPSAGGQANTRYAVTNTSINSVVGTHSLSFTVRGSSKFAKIAAEDNTPLLNSEGVEIGYSPTSLSLIRIEDNASTETFRKSYTNLDVTYNLFDGILEIKGDCKTTPRLEKYFPYRLAVLDQFDNPAVSGASLPQFVTVTPASTFIGGYDFDGLGGTRATFPVVGDKPSGQYFKLNQMSFYLDDFDRMDPSKESAQYTYSDSVSTGINFEQNNPYILAPDDKLILGFQTAVPGFHSGFTSFANLGGGIIPPQLDDQGNLQTVHTAGSRSRAIDTGKCIETTFAPYIKSKLVLYGSYMQNGAPKYPTRKDEFSTSGVVYSVIGGTDYDQYELYLDSEFSGSMNSEMISPTEFSRIANARDVLSITFGSRSNDIGGNPKHLFTSGSVDRFTTIYTGDNSDPTNDYDLVYFDSLPVDLTNYIQVASDEKKIIPVKYLASGQKAADETHVMIPSLITSRTDENKIDESGLAMFIGAPTRQKNVYYYNTLAKLLENIGDNLSGDISLAEATTEIALTADQVIMLGVLPSFSTISFDPGGVPANVIKFNITGTKNSGATLEVAWISGAPLTLTNSNKANIRIKVESLLETDRFTNLPVAKFEKQFITDWRQRFIFERYTFASDDSVVSIFPNKEFDPADSRLRSRKETFASFGIDTDDSKYAEQLAHSESGLKIFQSPTYDTRQWVVVNNDGSDAVFSTSNNANKDKLVAVMTKIKTISSDYHTYFDKDTGQIRVTDRSGKSLSSVYTNQVNQVNDSEYRQAAATLFGFGSETNRSLSTFTTEDISGYTGSNPLDTFQVDTDGAGGVDTTYKLLPGHARQSLEHPKGVKYGMINYDHLRPKVVFSRTHYGHFADLLEGRKNAVYTTLSAYSNNSEFTPDKRTMTVKVKFFDPSRRLITNEDALKYLFSQNLDKYQRSRVPFFDLPNPVIYSEDGTASVSDHAKGGRVRLRKHVLRDQVSIFDSSGNDPFAEFNED
tara:strand:- start:7023 stop:22568 length:15546 start_codon:yes stop_codon:yes gene_type:complete